MAEDRGSADHRSPPRRNRRIHHASGGAVGYRDAGQPYRTTGRARSPVYPHQRHDRRRPRRPDHLHENTLDLAEAGCARAFSSEVDTGSRKENASKRLEPGSDSIRTDKALGPGDTTHDEWLVIFIP